MGLTWFVRSNGDAKYHNSIAMTSSDALSPPCESSLNMINNALFLIRNKFAWLMDRQFVSMPNTHKLYVKGWRMGEWAARTCWS